MCRYPACAHGVDVGHSVHCLHPQVRQQIYEDAGMVTNQTVDLSPHDRLQPLTVEEDLATTRSLMLAARAVHLEVLACVYSTNKFFIQYTRSEGLSALRCLSPRGISFLTELVVHLTPSTCEITSYRNSRVDGHDKLRDCCPAGHEAVLEWQTAAAHVIAHITRPAQLRLHFVCDVDEVHRGAHAIEPFLHLTSFNAPLLLGCSIRLGRHRNPALSALARRAAAAATRTEQAYPFRFLDLPREVRQHVLDFTDLVTPYRQVEWTRSGPVYVMDGERASTAKGGYFCRRRICECGGHRFTQCPQNWHYALRFQECGPDDSCFCERHHAAAWAGSVSTASLCRCWTPPSALFLVCRKMREDAIQVFFRRNRVIVIPDGGECHIAVSSTPARLPISEYLVDIVVPQPHALRSLRCLEIVFPPLGDARGDGIDFLHEDTPAYCDWVRTIDQVKAGLSLPALTIRVYFADYLFPLDGWDGKFNSINPFRQKMTRNQALTVIRSYYRTVKPLSALRGVSRFFVDAAWPENWSHFCIRQMQQDRQKMVKLMRKLNQNCEALVMGPDYRSGNREPHVSRQHDKSVVEPRDSLWLEHYHDWLVHL